MTPEQLQALARETAEELADRAWARSSPEWPFFVPIFASIILSALEKATAEANKQLQQLRAERDALLKTPSGKARVAEAKCRDELRAERDELKRMVSLEQDHAAELRAKLAVHETAMRHAKEALDSDLIVASCNCLTKTPDATHHKIGCKYRLIVERDSLRAERDELRRACELAEQNLHVILTKEADYKVSEVLGLWSIYHAAKAALTESQKKSQ